MEVRALLMAAALSGGLGVLLGAFGAHGLSARLDADALATWQTAVRYHLWHALAMLSVAALNEAGFDPGGRAMRDAGWLFLGGTVVFSGSLYLLALAAAPWVGPVTPLGGLALVAGWLRLAWAAWRAPA